jgi:hypothetical protein
MHSQKYPVYFSFLFISVYIAGCSSVQELPSKWKKSDIVVDGLDNEWQQDLSYFEDEKIAVGMKNDGENFYVAIKSIDRETQLKIVRGGMTIWFDPQGGTKKILGIHFPLGTAAMGGAPVAPTHTRGSRETPDATNDYSALEERFSNSLRNLEIIGPGPVDKEQIPVVSSYKTRGIKVSIRDTMGSLFYELVVPMKSPPPSAWIDLTRKPPAIETDTGKIIGVGIITDDVRRSMTDRAPDEGAPNGGYGKPGMGGGYGGGMGGRRGGGKYGQNSGASSPIEIWMKVKVASP